MKNSLVAVYAFVSGLAAMHLVAYLLPESMTWGFHFLVFLGPAYVVGYIALVATLLFIARKDLLERGIALASSGMANRQAAFLLAAVGLFIGAGFLFRLGVPLLGDSWFLVKNFSQALSGTEPLYPRNEPLSTFYYSGISSLLGVSTYDDFLLSFFVGGMVMGAAFVVLLFFIVKELFPESEGRFAAFLLAVSLPASYLFFGYVETYAPVCVGVSVYVLTGLLFLRGKIPFTIVILAFLLQMFTHYLTALLFPSLLYIAYRGFRRDAAVDVLIGAFIAVSLIFAGILYTGVGMADLYSQVPHKHYLPLSVPTGGLEEYSFPYTLLSWYHIVDFANLALLLAPASIFLCVAAYVHGRPKKGREAPAPMPPGARFLCLGIMPVILFAGVAKFDLGIARDWDVTAPFAFLFVLAAAAYYLRTVPGRPGVRVVAFLAAVSVVHSLLWFSMNASNGAALNRFHSLLDPRIVSQSGIYGGHLSLAMFHHQTGLGIETPVELWKGYVRDYPVDIRGYVNVIRNVGESEEAGLGELISRWREAAGDSDRVTKAIYTACFEAGNQSLSDRQPERARVLYDAALGINPQSAAVHNNLGILFAQGGDIAGAVEMFERTIVLDSNYNQAYFNLGRAYSEIGKRDRARWAFTESARRGNADARKYLETGVLTP